MTIVLLAVIVAIVLVFAFRGGLTRFGQPRTHRNGMLAFAAVALGASLAGDHPSVAVFWLLSGAIALCVYARLNRGRPGLLLAASGLTVNAIVTIVNYAMPVSLDAADRAGVPPSRVQLTTDPLREPLTDATVLPWLSESIPLALPVRPAVASPGDLLVAAGAAVFLFTGLTGRGRPRPTPAVKKGKRTRGKGKAAKDAAAPTDAPPQDGPPAVFDTAALEATVGTDERVPAARSSRAAVRVGAPGPAPGPFSSPRMGSDAVTGAAAVPPAATAAMTSQDSSLDASPFSGSRARADSTYAPEEQAVADQPEAADAVATRPAEEAGALAEPSAAAEVEGRVVVDEPAPAEELTVADEQFAVVDRPAAAGGESPTDEPAVVHERHEVSAPTDAEQPAVVVQQVDLMTDVHLPAVAIPQQPHGERAAGRRAGRGAKKKAPGGAPRQASGRRIAGRHATGNGSHAATRVIEPVSDTLTAQDDEPDDATLTSAAPESAPEASNGAEVPTPWTAPTEEPAPAPDRSTAPDDRTGPPAAWRI